MNILIAVIVALVVFWLLSYVVPVFLAALIALVVFIAFISSGTVTRRW